jgi:hypothetical protein
MQSLSKEQLKHDRINLGRLVQRLENVISNDNWDEGGKQYGEDAWVKAEGMAQVGQRLDGYDHLMPYNPLRKFDMLDNYFSMLTTMRNWIQGHNHKRVCHPLS